eukprot:scaffold1027_cov413-Prasinococcus_capsulatus_cf.AAC.3
MGVEKSGPCPAAGGCRKGPGSDDDGGASSGGGAPSRGASADTRKKPPSPAQRAEAAQRRPAAFAAARPPGAAGTVQGAQATPYASVGRWAACAFFWAGGATGQTCDVGAALGGPTERRALKIYKSL